ncbi:MAG TPA: GxxExxY protein [Acidobacteriota bacterium]|nr:GxxExxY protein [Acidobacteriota bacterium]
MISVLASVRTSLLRTPCCWNSKCVDQIHPIHLSQVITYLKLLRLKRGFLINFNRRLIKEGIKRVSI